MRKTALVTGGSRGIGAEIVKLFSAQGVDVSFTYREKEKRATKLVEGVMKEGGLATAFQFDIADVTSQTHLLKNWKLAHPKPQEQLDLIILNASGGLESDAAEDYAMEVNCHGPKEFVKKALLYMSKGGTIVLINSNWGHYPGQLTPIPGYKPIAVSKKAGELSLIALRSLFEETEVNLIIISGPLIADTGTHMLLKRGQQEWYTEYMANGGKELPASEFADFIVQASNLRLPFGSTVLLD
jgi:3-oxoacyl-[acyl-carrier protein] reductase